MPGYSGQVLAVVSNAVYLSGNDGEIIWVAQMGLPAHTRCVLASFEPQSLSIGTSFAVVRSSLQISDDATIDLDGAAEWKPLAIKPGQAAALTDVRERFWQVLAAVLSLGGEGLGRTIALIPALVRDRGLPLPTDALVSRALGPITGIARACLDRDMACIVEQGKELVGLGPGLTPSGDDYLGGLLFIAHHLSTAYADDMRWERQAIAALIEWAHTRTNRISHTLLGDMALGLGPAPLHDLTTSLLRGKDIDRVMPEITRLIGMGHTSGWDILAGALTGMLLVARG
jgi:hypothetical protein